MHSVKTVKATLNPEIEKKNRRKKKKMEKKQQQQRRCNNQCAILSAMKNDSTNACAENERANERNKRSIEICSMLGGE